MGGGECRRAEAGTTDAALWVLQEMRNQVAICVSCSPEKQRETVNIPARVVGTQCTKPSDRCRNEAQRGHYVVAPVVRQNKPWSLDTCPHSPRGSSGPRRSYRCEHWAIKHIICKPYDWNDRRIFPPEWQVHAQLILVTGGDTEVKQLLLGGQTTSATADLSQLTTPRPGDFTGS